MPLRKIEIATDTIGTGAITHTYESWSDTSIELSAIDLTGIATSDIYFRVTSPDGTASTWFGPIEVVPAFQITNVSPDSFFPGESGIIITGSGFGSI